jgi:hypothetical protein
LPNAKGCDCYESGAQLCLPDSTGKRVALTCQNQAWIAVEDGACYPQICGYSDLELSYVSSGGLSGRGSVNYYIINRQMTTGMWAALDAGGCSADLTDEQMQKVLSAANLVDWPAFQAESFPQPQHCADYFCYNLTIRLKGCQDDFQKYTNGWCDCGQIQFLQSMTDFLQTVRAIGEDVGSTSASCGNM